MTYGIAKIWQIRVIADIFFKASLLIFKMIKNGKHEGVFQGFKIKDLSKLNIFNDIT